MAEKLSITDSEKEVSLDSNKSDAAAIGMKSILGIIPFGSLISEIATTVIPNQRTERIVQFVEILNEKFKYLEKDVVELKTKSEEFTDLLQDGFIQASRALSKERLEYIASLLKNSLTDEEIEHLGKKKLLNLLGELNDAEIVWLKNYSFIARIGGNESYKKFYEKYKNILSPVKVTLNSSIKQPVDEKALQQSYIDNLLRLNLIKRTFEIPKEDERPEFDAKTGVLKVKKLNTTPLGNLLIKYIDLTEAETRP